MKRTFNPISSRVPHMLHGADYNPEQWLRYPEVLEEDIRLMKLANCNVMSIGIFHGFHWSPRKGYSRLIGLTAYWTALPPMEFMPFGYAKRRKTGLDVGEVSRGAARKRETGP